MKYYLETYSFNKEDKLCPVMGTANTEVIYAKKPKLTYAYHYLINTHKLRSSLRPFPVYSLISCYGRLEQVIVSPSITENQLIAMYEYFACPQEVVKHLPPKDNGYEN